MDDRTPHAAAADVRPIAWTRSNVVRYQLRLGALELQLVKHSETSPWFGELRGIESVRDQSSGQWPLKHFDAELAPVDAQREAMRWAQPLVERVAFEQTMAAAELAERIGG